MQPRMDGQAPADSPRTALAGLLPELRTFARFLAGGRRAEADDLVQEALLRALRGLDRFEPGTNLRAWAFTILRNTFRETLRARRREERRRAAAPPDPETVAPAQQGPGEMRELLRGLAALSPLQREALVLVGAQGLSHEEAAAVCRVPVGTMKVRVFRARQALARALGRDGAPGD